MTFYEMTIAIKAFKSEYHNKEKIKCLVPSVLREEKNIIKKGRSFPRSIKKLFCMQLFEYKKFASLLKYNFLFE